jgi:hypothetical protein
LADKPAALVRQLNDLQAQQGKTYAAREYAADNVRNCQEAVKKAEETLRFEKQRHRQAEVEYQQVADEICRVQNAA